MATVVSTLSLSVIWDHNKLRMLDRFNPLAVRQLVELCSLLATRPLVMVAHYCPWWQRRHFGGGGASIASDGGLEVVNWQNRWPVAQFTPLLLMGKA